NDQYLFQFFELRQLFIQLINHAFVKSAYSGMADQFSARVKRNVVHLCPVLQHRKMRHNNYAGELSPIADHGSISNQHVVFEAILYRLWGDELTAAGLEQVLLAIGNFEEAIRIDFADISGLEPLPFESLLSLLWILPVLLENRWSSYQ